MFTPRARLLATLIAAASPPAPGALAAPAHARVVLLKCAVPLSTIIVQACDKSAEVSAACPAPGGSCADALAIFQSAPYNLKLLFVTPAAVGEFLFTLGDRNND